MDTGKASKGRVLVVEDDAIIGDGICRKLRAHGYDTAGPVNSGQKAVEEARSWAPDIVLMDIVLKGPMDGIEAAGQMAGFTDVPIVYLTAYSDNATVGRARASGHYGYLLKPIHDRELELAIDTALYRFRTETLLRESREKYKRLIEGMLEGVVAYDETTRITFVNQQILDMLGYAESEMVGKSFRNFIPQEDHERAARSVEKRKQGVPGVADEYSVRCKDGSWKHMRISSRPILGPGGAFNGSVLIASDITEQRRLDRTVRTLERAVGSMGLGLVLGGTDGNITYANGAACQMTGYTHDSLIGLPMRALVPRGQWDPFNPATMKLLEREMAFVRKDGGIFPVALHGSLVSDESGEPVAMVASFEDITERRHMLDDIRRKSVIIDKARTAIGVTDLRGTVKAWNAEAADVSGISGDAAMDRHIAESIGTLDPHGFDAHILGPLLDAGSTEFVSLSGAGRGVDIRVSASLLTDEGGRPAEIVWLLSNVSAVRASFNALRESEGRYRALFHNATPALAYLKVDTGGGKPVDLAFLDINHSFERMFGMRREDVIGRRASEVFSAHAGIARDWIATLGRPGLTGEPLRTEYFVDFLARWMMVNVYSPLPGHVTLSLNDITAMKQTEADLQSQVESRNGALVEAARDIKRGEEARVAVEDRFRRIFDESPIGIAICDSDFKFIRVNPVFCSMTGYGADELLGNTFIKISHSEDVESNAQIVRSAMSGLQPRASHDKRCIRKDGSMMWVRLTISVLPDYEEGRTCTMGMMEDITERKAWEDENSRLIAELREAADQVRALRGMLPICPSCKKVRDDKGYWSGIEHYLAAHSEAEFTHSMCPQCAKRLYADDSARERKIDPLSKREIEVLGWVRHGKSTWDIASILGITESTVKFHMANIMRKLDAVSRSQALAIALELGILPDSPVAKAKAARPARQAKKKGGAKKR